jgi:predicted DNA-binding WGR domain protein
MRRFEFVGGNSSKFWTISQSGRDVTVSFGRIGTDGQCQTKTLDSEEAASSHVEQMIASKLKKGYEEV